MSDSRREVEKILENEPVIRKGLQWGIINSRALARFIQSRDGLDASPEAILGIIRRYPLKEQAEREEPSRVLRNCELAMRDKVAGLVLENGPETMKRISEFAASIKSTRGENLRVVVGLRWITVIANQKAMDQFRESFSSKEVFRYEKDLAEISILLTPAAPATKGIYARITNELLLNDVNLVSIDTSHLEIIILINEENASKAIATLQNIISDESSQFSTAIVHNSFRTHRGRVSAQS
jgi:hypothetical protein